MKKLLPDNVNCCKIENIEDRPCKHEASDYNRDCIDCAQFVWVRVWNTLNKKTI